MQLSAGPWAFGTIPAGDSALPPACLGKVKAGQEAPLSQRGWWDCELAVRPLGEKKLPLHEYSPSSSSEGFPQAIVGDFEKLCGSVPLGDR